MTKTGSILLSALAGTTALLVSAAPPAVANPNAINPIPVLNGTHGLPVLHGRTQAVLHGLNAGLISANAQAS